MEENWALIGIRDPKNGGIQPARPLCSFGIPLMVESLRQNAISSLALSAGEFGLPPGNIPNQFQILPVQTSPVTGFEFELIDKDDSLTTVVATILLVGTEAHTTFLTSTDQRISTIAVFNTLQAQPAPTLTIHSVTVTAVPEPSPALCLGAIGKAYSVGQYARLS